MLRTDLCGASDDAGVGGPRRNLAVFGVHKAVGLARGDVGRIDADAVQDAAVDVVFDRRPAQAAAHELLQRRRVQQTTETTGTNNVVELTATATAEQKTRQVQQLLETHLVDAVDAQPFPHIRERAALHLWLVRRRRQQTGVDRANARAADDLETRVTARARRQFITDVFDDPRFVTTTGTTTRQHEPRQRRALALDRLFFRRCDSRRVARRLFDRGRVDGPWMIGR